MIIAAGDSTAIWVALIGGATTVLTGALALLGVWITARNQAQNAAKDQMIADLEHRLEAIENRSRRAK